MRVKCLAQYHNTICPVRTRSLTIRSGVPGDVAKDGSLLFAILLFHFTRLDFITKKCKSH